MKLKNILAFTIVVILCGYFCDKVTAHALNTVNKHYGGYVPSAIDRSYLDGISYSLQSYKGVSHRMFKTAETALPSRYDQRDQEIITPVKIQDFPNCWAFPGMAACEANIIKKGISSPTVKKPTKNNVRLSEWHTTYYAYNDESDSKPGYTNRSGNPYYAAGGGSYLIIMLLSRGSGPVYESLAPAPVDYTPYQPKVRKPSYKLRNALYLHTYGISEEELIMTIKKGVMDYGAVTSDMLIDETSEYWNNSTSAYYTSLLSSAGVNHIATIVGWDDDFAIENFNTENRPPAKGAWIVKNSWGADWRDGGYFYVSYAEKTFHPNYVYEMGEADARENIYQYDMLGYTSERVNGYLSGPAFMGAIYTAVRNENLNSVSIYTLYPNTVCDIAIYKNISHDDPTINGERVLFMSDLVIPTPGFNTIDLIKNVPIDKNQRFSVVVKVSIPNYYPGFAVETKEPWTQKAVPSGLSFINKNAAPQGSSFNDVQWQRQDDCDVCLKVSASRRITDEDRVNVAIQTHFEGRTSASDVVSPNINNVEQVTVEIYNADNNLLIEEAAGTTNEYGVFSFETDVGDYEDYRRVKVWIKGERYLSAMFPQDIDINGNSWRIDVAKVLKGGDANGDNVVNVRDFLILRASMLKTKGLEGYEARSDFNADDIVNVRDFLILHKNILKQADPRPSSAASFIDINTESPRSGSNKNASGGGCNSVGSVVAIVSAAVAICCLTKKCTR